jgi:hypothetical protein
MLGLKHGCGIMADPTLGRFCISGVTREHWVVMLNSTTWRACATAVLWCATVVLRSADLMECKVEGPAPELSHREGGDDSLLGIQVEEWKRDGVTATARMLPVSQYAWIGLEAGQP